MLVQFLVNRSAKWSNSVDEGNTPDSGECEKNLFRFLGGKRVFCLVFRDPGGPGVCKEMMEAVRVGKTRAMEKKISKSKTS